MTSSWRYKGRACLRCGQRFPALYGTLYCSRACAEVGKVRFCRCESPIPIDGDCFKCGRELPVGAVR